MQPLVFIHCFYTTRTIRNETLYYILHYEIRRKTTCFRCNSNETAL